MRTDQPDVRRQQAVKRPPAPLAAASTRLTAGLSARVSAALRAMRPAQWTKNGFVLLALIFARMLDDSRALERTLLAFVAFCFAASAVYIINDLADRDRDRSHPRKRLRPIASGALSLRGAVITLTLCLLVAAGLVAFLVVTAPPNANDPFRLWGGSPLLFALTMACYVAINIAYSFWLKHLVLWDIFIIAAGFVLRALAGAFVIAVPISMWFYLCATFLALFLALGKRRAELIRLSDQAGAHRQNLRQYSLTLLDQLIGIVVTSMLLTYSLYTFQGENSSHALMLTIPVAIFGTFRYLYLMYMRAEGDRPDEVLWRDPQILGAVVVGALLVLVLLYILPIH
ncbi:MAG TPA: decaprenyl-phosphate phosphoribosyltransferase [Ktedonobacterales bacterium]|nr:decaprenyl-phosphate phosphoribosyltransferase [Ktedonobacterales bacterium]